MPNTLQELAHAWADYGAELETSRRVLIVEDDPASGRLFSRTLEQAGFYCEVARDSGEAIHTFLAGGFDGVLMDKNLPDSDGVDLIRRLQRFDSDCEVVIITGYANVESVFEAINLRAMDYLTKPLKDVAVLPATFHRALRRRRRRLQARRMLSDLRREVGRRAAPSDSSDLVALRREIEAFKNTYRSKRKVVMAQPQKEILGTCLDDLKGVGFEIIAERTARLALERLSRTIAQVAIVTEPFAEMPGLTFLDELRELYSSPEVVFVSARADVEGAVAALNRGAAACFTAPVIDRKAFTAAIRRACDDHVERMYHYKLVTALHMVLSSMEPREPRGESTADVNEVLGEFDVDTARMAIKTLRSDDP